MLKTIPFLVFLIFTVNIVKSQSPALTMTTSKPIGSTVNFDIWVSNENTVVQVDYGDGIKVSMTVVLFKSFSGTLQGSQTISIYGNGITGFDCGSNELTSLDISNCPELKNIECAVNQLTALDVTSNTTLQNILCNSNRITVLDVTKNLNLTSLSVSDNPLLTIDVTKNIELRSLWCASNQLTTLDVSNNIKLGSLICETNMIAVLDVGRNTALTSLYCYSNQLASLDLSNNTALKELHCSSNQLTALNLSENTALTKLSCNFNQITQLDLPGSTSLIQVLCYNNLITELDVTHNPALTSLFCYSNRINALDVSKNTLLSRFYCSGNRLSTLDVSQNTLLIELLCGSNNLTFCTLPLPNSNWTKYLYASQKPIQIPKTFKKGVEIDLSCQYLIKGNITSYTWKTKSGGVLVKNTDYTINNGKTVFIKAPSDSVYCEMKNSTFPDFTGGIVLKTTLTRIHPGLEQTIIFDQIPDKNTDDAPFELTATSSSGLLVGFSSSEPAVASIDSNIVTIHKAGTIIITAFQTGDDNWEATSKTQVFTITEEHKEDQTITFDPLSSKTYGDQPFVLSAGSSSGLPVIFLSSNPNVAILSGDTVVILGAGNTEITAFQSGDSVYKPAIQVVQILTVQKADLIIHADNKARYCGVQNPEFTLYYIGLIKIGDLQDIVPPSITCNAVITSFSGVYEIVLSGGTSSDYNLYLENGELTILNIPDHIYVKYDASGNNDGTSWQDAFTDLSNALNAIPAGEIWVARGTYYPGGSNPSRSSFFGMQNNIRIYGGFAGTEAELQNRNYLINKTILSGNIGDVNDPTDNIYHIIRNTNIDSTALLDGFIIQYSYGDNSTPFGGAIFNYQASPQIYNCNITNNFTGNCGGIFNYNMSNARIVNCNIYDNTSISCGGITCQAKSDAIIINCNIVNNRASMVNTSSGGIFIDDSSPSFINCILWGNSGDWAKDCIVYSESYPLFQQCILNDSSAYFKDTYGAVSVKKNNINKNPLFKQDASDFYTLEYASPCIDSGMIDTTGLLLPSLDLICNNRIINQRIDIGAVEFTEETPTVQSRNIVFSDQESTQIDISWQTGNGTARLVFIRAGNGFEAIPEDNTYYNDSLIFEKGDEINVTGWFCVYNGSGNHITVSGLKPGWAYDVMVLEYNGTRNHEKYLLEKTYNNPNDFIMSEGYKFNQEITFDEIPIQTYGDPKFKISATATSGLPVTFFSKHPEVAFVSGDSVEIRRAGHAEIVALQSGSSEYNPAPEAFQTIVINKANLLVSADNKIRKFGELNPLLTYHYAGFVYDDGFSSIYILPIILCEGNIDSPVGDYEISFSGGMDNNYNFIFTNGIMTILPLEICATFNAIPVIKPISCFGANDAEIHQLVQGENQPISFVWTSSQMIDVFTDSVITNVGPGTYTCKITDAYNCVTTNTSEIFQPNEIIIDTVIDREINMVNLLVQGGYPPYEYLWSDGTVSPDLEDADVGIYSVIVNDQHNCSTQLGNIELSSIPTNIETGHSNSISFYPNPVNDYIYISRNSLNTISIEIFDMYGHLVQKDILDSNRIELKGLKPGIYILKCENTLFHFVKL